jgi:hypothetical protein
MTPETQSVAQALSMPIVATAEAYKALGMDEETANNAANITLSFL